MTVSHFKAVTMRRRRLSKSCMAIAMVKGAARGGAEGAQAPP